jgi:hypothetical protein
LTRILLKATDWKILACLLLVVIATTACDRPNSGNADGSVDLNNPLLKGDAPQTSTENGNTQTQSPEEDRTVSFKSKLVAACADDTIFLDMARTEK